MSWHQWRPAKQFCSISRMRLLDLSQTHGNTIILFPFFEICVLWLPIRQRIVFKLATMAYKIMSARSVSFLPCRGLHTAVCHSWSAASAIDWQIGTACSKNTNCDIWPTLEPPDSYRTLVVRYKCAVEVWRFETTFGSRAFAVAGQGVWNSLPSALRETSSLV